MPEIAVVHLVRASNGVEPVSRFVASYARHPAGVDHDLVVVYKGFSATGPSSAILDELAAISQRSIAIDDRGFDIGAYLAASTLIAHRYVCFLNSFSVIRGDSWLAKLVEHVRRDRVGIVGASGSWESQYENHVRAAPARASWPGAVAHRIETVRLKSAFPRFPNPHLRTNAFMIERDTFLEMRRFRIATKRDAHRFESGRAGLTRHVLDKGLEALVVGANGIAYPPREWAVSNTFRSSSQENLLVADNQTRMFEAADAASRARLAFYAWGDAADVAVP